MVSTIPSTLGPAEPQKSGFDKIVDGLFRTGLEFLSDNLFGGKQENENSELRKQNAALIAQQQVATASPFGQGTGITPGILVGGVVLLGVAFLATR